MHRFGSLVWAPSDFSMLTALAAGPAAPPRASSSGLVEPVLFDALRSLSVSLGGLLGGLAPPSRFPSDADVDSPPPDSEEEDAAAASAAAAAASAAAASAADGDADDGADAALAAHLEAAGPVAVGAASATVDALGAIRVAPLTPRVADDGESSGELAAQWREVPDTRAGVALDAARLSALREGFEAGGANRFAQNALRTSHAIGVARSADARLDHAYTHVVGTPPLVPAMREDAQPERSWIVAAHRAVEYALAARLNVTRGAELSVGYTFFWAAFEKANAFLELAIRTRRQPLTSYAMRRVYEEGLPEGGSWSLYQQVHLKYGAVPATAYVDTVGAASGDLLQLLDWELRRFALELRTAGERGGDDGALRGRKAKMLSHVYSLLAVHLGPPPASFTWKFAALDGSAVRVSGQTPLGFARDVVRFSVEERVVLAHDPRRAAFALFTPSNTSVANLAGVRAVHMNVPIELLERLVATSIALGRHVVVAADATQQASFGTCTLNTGLYAVGELLDAPLEMSKADRLATHDSRPTHTLVLTGVDFADDDGDGAPEPAKFRAENVRGAGAELLAMSAAWFRAYVYSAVVDVELLAPALLERFTNPETAVHELPPWDALSRFYWTR